MVICPNYHRLYLQLVAACTRPADLHTTPLDDPPIREIRARMSVHIQTCPACQERLAWAKGKVADARNVLDQTLR